MMNATLFTAFKTVLELLFFVGCFRALLCLKKSDLSLPQRFLPVFFLALFFLPFLFYALIGIFAPRFGHVRNFFYLLPLFFLFAFYGLAGIFRSRRVFCAGALVLLLFLAATTLLGVRLPVTSLFRVSPILENSYKGRALLQLASTLEADDVFVPYTFSHTPWVFNYYANRLHGAGKIFPYFERDRPFLFEEEKSAPSQGNDVFTPRAFSYTPWIFSYYAKGLDLSGRTFPYFQRERPGFFDGSLKASPPRTIAVIEEGDRSREAASGGTYSFGGRSLPVKLVKTYHLSAGPGGLSGLFINPVALVTVYFLRED
jgi:hypothetical protein